MASSRKRVRSPQTPTTCPDQVDSFEEDDARIAKKFTDMESSLHTEIRLPVDMKEEIDDEEFSQLQQSCLTTEQQQKRHAPLKNDDYNILQFSRSKFNSEILEPLDIPLSSTTDDGSTNSSRFTATEDVKNIKLEPEPIPSSSSAFLPDYRPSFLLAFETPDDMQDETLPNPDPAPSSSTSPDFSLPSKVPTFVSLSFGFSDDEDDLPQSSEPTFSLMTISAPELTSESPEHADSTNLTPGAELNIIESDTKVEVQQTSSSTLALAEKKEYPNTSETLHSELHLPVDVEDIKTEEDNTSKASLSYDRTFLDFMQGSKDAMFLEEVSMTVGQFNELLNNVLLYNCFQSQVGLMNRMKLEAVLKFLVKGESIANLAQHYKIGKQTFSKFLPDVLNAIYGVLGLFRVKTGENRWAKVQKGFTERLGLPNCCGVINAKTIITWRPDTGIHLPIVTITDSEHSILSLDCTAAIEDQGIDFKTTRMYYDIHSTELQIPHLGFLVGKEHLHVTRFVYPLYSTVGDDMPIPKLFNSRVERAFRISENTYSILTSKFKVYDKIMSLSPSVGKVVVKATCALHNWLKQTSPGYITPGLLDEELEDGVWKIGSCHYGSKQIFQPIQLFQAKHKINKNFSYARRRDLYAYSLFVLEQTKKSESQNTA